MTNDVPIIDPSKENINLRRATKNKIVLALVLGFVALMWAITIVKMQHGG